MTMRNFVIYFIILSFSPPLSFVFLSHLSFTLSAVLSQLSFPFSRLIVKNLSQNKDILKRKKKFYQLDRWHLFPPCEFFLLHFKHSKFGATTFSRLTLGRMLLKRTCLITGLLAYILDNIFFCLHQCSKFGPITFNWMTLFRMVMLIVTMSRIITNTFCY